MHHQINKPIADALRTRPASSSDTKANVFGRFGSGYTEVRDGPCEDADLTRPGGYCTYAYKTTVIPLSVNIPNVTFWKPAIYFVADELRLRPEPTFDGDPFQRNVPLVPFADGRATKAVRRRIFSHLEKPLERLVAFYASTGQRWEVVVERERRRCMAEGQPFDMPELPLDSTTLS